jgi:hypothetical protein
MRDLLIILALAATFSLVSGVATVAALVWALRRRNRVAHGVRSPAPLLWLCSPVAPARLHRRLRRAVHVADDAATRDRSGAVAELASRLASEAVLLDAELVRVWALPHRARRSYLTDVSARAVTVETSAVRLSGLVPVPVRNHPSRSEGLQQLTERIDLLVAARADVERVATGALGTAASQVPNAAAFNRRG